MDPFKLAEQNNIDALQPFLTRDTINLQNKEGNTILMIACKEGHYSLAKICFELGADKHIANHSGLTAYQLAFEAKKTLLMKLFYCY
jgi:ankyrin repeat protein